MKAFQKSIAILFVATISSCVPIEGDGTKNSFFGWDIAKCLLFPFGSKSIDFEHVESDFVFSVDNPNPVGFSIDNFDYNLAFEEIDWANGDNADGLQILPDDESLVALPVEIVWTELFDMVQALRGKDNIDFNLDGNFGVRLNSRNHTF